MLHVIDSPDRYYFLSSFLTTTPQSGMTLILEEKA